MVRPWIVADTAGPTVNSAGPTAVLSEIVVRLAPEPRRMTFADRVNPPPNLPGPSLTVSPSCAQASASAIVGNGCVGEAVAHVGVDFAVAETGHTWPPLPAVS